MSKNAQRGRGQGIEAAVTSQESVAASPVAAAAKRGRLDITTFTRKGDGNVSGGFMKTLRRGFGVPHA